MGLSNMRVLWWKVEINVQNVWVFFWVLKPCNSLCELEVISVCCIICDVFITLVCSEKYCKWGWMTQWGRLVVMYLTLCSRVDNWIKYPLMPWRFKFFECSTPKCTVTYILTLCRLVSYTCRQTHSQNGEWENNESHDRGSNRVTEKTTLVVAQLQSVN
jgi:hypothetical protein